MKKIKNIILSLTIFALVSPVSAAQLKGDSVMTPNTGVFSGSLQGSTQNIATPGYTSSSANEISWGSCPAGFTYNGNSQYPAQIRTVVTYYLGGIYAGQSASGWSDLDFDCTKMEYQTIGCPTSYTGTQSQSRLVSTRDGALDYGAWNTYSSNCTYVPPRASGVVDGIIASVRSSQYNGFGGGTPLTGNLRNQMGVSYGSRFGVTIYRPNAQLNCVASSDWGGQGGDAGNSGFGGIVANPGQSIGGSGGYCTLSNGGNTAKISGDCNSTSGGDGDFCIGATFTVNIIGVNGCIVTTETKGAGTITNNYNICQ